MIRFDDYPCAQLREALGTVLGRVGLIVLVALGGSMLGGWTATSSVEGLWLGVTGFPSLSLASIFHGYGFVVLPALFLYAIISVRCELPLRLTLLCSLFMWWNIHKTIRWTTYDSPMAKQQKKFQAEIHKINEMIEKENKKNRE
jgi:hypothetical protein